MAGKIINKRTKGFTVIPNAVLKSKDLSWKAKGLMCYLLSLSEEWSVFKADIANRSTDGYDSMISGWKELEKLGYIQTLTIREKGLFKGYDYLIVESPIQEKPEPISPESENPQLINTSLQPEPLESLNINEEFNNSSENDKNTISVEANLKTKKNSAHHRIISKFFDEMHDDFVFSPIHAKSVGLLRKNITSLLKKHNRVADDQEVGDFALQLFDKLPSYYLDKDLAVINSKFNEIVLQIKNTTNGKPTGKQSTRETAAARFGS